MTKAEQVYGSSLYELAKEEQLTEEIYEQLRQVIGIFDQTDYWRFLSLQSIAKQERCSALDEALGGKVQPYLLSFLKILCENEIISQLKGCAKEYRRRYNEDHDIVEVCAVTAVELAEPLKKKLREKLQTVLGKTVELTGRVDPACVGGVLLELPGRQLDGTVRHRLDALADTLKAAAL